jgi:hypothetical protein
MSLIDVVLPEGTDPQTVEDEVDKYRSNERLITDGGKTEDEKRGERQIGPRLNIDVADDFEVIIRHLHNGKYKGRLSDEVENAIELYIGKVLSDNPTWINDAKDKSQKERFEDYAEQYQESCANAPVESQVIQEFDELKKEIRDVNATNTNMLSQILSQVSENSAETSARSD